MALDPDLDVIRHYETDNEHERLTTSGPGRLELARTQRILLRHLPPAPASVLDVGGAAGIYSRWLLDLGYDSEVIDLTPLHVQQCVAAGIPAEVGDARHLQRDDESYDVVLVMGPLYHLPSASDRALVWSEAFRVLRPGGLVAAATINRFAGLFDGMSRRWAQLERYFDQVVAELATGAHHNPSGEDLFTTAYFHRPDELVPEAAAAGLVDVAVTSIEGPAWMMATIETEPIERFAEVLDLVEQEPSLLGVSSHLLTTARKPR
jgi:2-polyprenyl-3-methyl-5-hydroxy-6-metoxy-1,4-benzoquinol methylase